MIVVENKYEKGEVVYLKTDKDQLPRMVYGFEVNGSDVLYKLVCGTLSSAHYDFEISIEKDVLMITIN